MERARKLGLDTSALDLMGYVQTYFLLGEPDNVQKVVLQAAGLPDEFMVTQALAATQLFSGEYQKGCSDHSAGSSTRRATPRRPTCRQTPF